MKNKFVKEFSEGDKVDEFFMLKNSDTKTDKNGNNYLDMIVGDKSGEIICRKFRATEEEIDSCKIGEIYRIIGIIKEYNGSLNFNANSIELVSKEVEIDIGDYVSAAPIKAEEMLKEIKVYINKINNKEIRKIVIEILGNYKDKLMYYPAAKSNHHSFKSGLLYHLLRMLRSAEAMGSVYTNINMDLLYSGILLHDICKIEEMESNTLGIVEDYTMEGKLLGHIIMGIKIIEKTAERLNVDKEISIMLEHMILSHHYQPEYGSPKKPMFLEAELLHYLDIIDARVYDFGNAVEGVKPGSFSERVYVLENRNIYNPVFDKEVKSELINNEIIKEAKQLKME
jgi:3'-5' exoribonuclease